MKKLWLAMLGLSGLLAAGAQAQDLSVSITNTTDSSVADTALPSTYQFTDTAVGGSTSVTLKIRDTAGYPVQVVTVLVSSASGSATANPNFAITGQITDKTLSTSSSSFEDVVASFSPLSQGALTGYLQIYYQVQNGCTFGSTTSPCTSKVLTASTFDGNGAAPALVLSYTGANGTALLQPNSATPLNFGNVSTSATSTLTFTLTNQSAAPISTPTVSLSSQTFNSSAFALDTSNLPGTLAAGATGAFTVEFAPGQVGLTTATLVVGSLQFPIEGTGIVVSDIDALQIVTVDADGVRLLPQAATPISFGELVAGASGSNVLTFTVTNPTTALDPVTLSTLATTGSAFTLAGGPTLPATIAVGGSITFTVTFSASAQGAYTGTLAIGTRVFSLSGSSVNSILPDATMSVDVQPLVSGQQAHLSINLASASTVSGIGELSMSFKPEVSDVTDDPSIVFVATSGRQLQVNVAVGAQSATYNSNSAITFQTGTTAGTVTFTLTFPNKATVTKTFVIAPAKISISSVTAVRQSPNLVVTVNGFDNTYSAGKMLFTFFDTSGNALTASGISVDSTSAFAQYFSTSSVGGSFAMQASFPVTGNVTQIGSVTVQMTNSAGSTSATESFQ